jgi:hypothetical protein
MFGRYAALSYDESGSSAADEDETMFVILIEFSGSSEYVFIPTAYGEMDDPASRRLELAFA